MMNIMWRHVVYMLLDTGVLAFVGARVATCAIAVLMLAMVTCAVYVQQTQRRGNTTEGELDKQKVKVW